MNYTFKSRVFWFKTIVFNREVRQSKLKSEHSFTSTTKTIDMAKLNL